MEDVVVALRKSEHRDTTLRKGLTLIMDGIRSLGANSARVKTYLNIPSAEEFAKEVDWDAEDSEDVENVEDCEYGEEEDVDEGLQEEGVDEEEEDVENNEDEENDEEDEENEKEEDSEDNVD
ncbi:hypothetical protein Fmac_025306 [Flemingia macrophylla]|uniref:Uncharacterized protein n=1 Tax=Flemingia macrophylla TaxID=520843 RepID=A0ABD1LRU8_9FABA